MSEYDCLSRDQADIMFADKIHTLYCISPQQWVSNYRLGMYRTLDAEIKAREITALLPYTSYIYEED